ncbi:hypothetical protein [Lignipirellula cremea]|uniref:Uncharacterized protein n=1 Tax=Lignipirellula cremea TaxID=2528010 RepID=A0A518DYJ8_9BACT|nr:hypothetical protein [Lignipirellula cremea]QDU96922.1 hypothetical protein Pla8534_47450 [Lignipirellula cremea]
MSPSDVFLQLERELNRQGVKTSFRTPGELVCATEGNEDALGGVSCWVMRQNDAWWIVAWNPVVFVVQESVDLAAFLPRILFRAASLDSFCDLLRESPEVWESAAALDRLEEEEE